jgi:CRISPR-associated endonuclease/helicase Cas3
MYGQPDNDQFWAKLHRDEDGGVLSWHPLIAHCVDVAVCMEWLLRYTLLGRRLAHLAGQRELSEVQLARLCALAMLHDAGKANHGFQDRASVVSRGGHLSPIIDALTPGAGDLADAIFMALGLEESGAWVEDPSSHDPVEAMMLAVFGHHGKPVPINPTGFRAQLWRATAARDPLEELRSLGAQLRERYPAAFEEEAPLKTSPAFQHLFNGALTLADWLGSDRAVFAFALPGEGCRDQVARRYASALFAQTHLDPRRARAALGAAPVTFARFAPALEAPWDVQRRCLELPIEPEGALTLLESDTGSGKTEAALGRFLRLFQAGCVDGMYFALPTRAAATQLHQRVVRAMACAIPEEAARPPVLLAVPGYLRVDAVDGRPGHAPFEVLWDHEQWRSDEVRQQHYRGWAAEHAKRFLAGAVVVGTIDQVLLSTLCARHAHMRAAALSRLLLVVDEVHASDTYMGRLLEEVLKHHLGAGGHALLMSATLGAAARARLFQTTVEPLAQALDQPYPSILHACATARGDRPQRAQASNHTKTVLVHARALLLDPEAIAALALEHASSGARVLVIRNTVAGCVKVQRAIEGSLEAGEADGVDLLRCQGVRAPHHGRFAPEDRKLLDVSIEDTFGKRARRSHLVAVATQTVEQSLDIDADLLITDLCPMDVLLQRIGRLHRHRDRPDRPEGSQQPQALVLVPKVPDLTEFIDSQGQAHGPSGLGTVYEDLLMAQATWCKITQQPIWTIPAQNRALVESCTHPEALASLADALGPAWRRHLDFMQMERALLRTQATYGLLNRDLPFGQQRFPEEDQGPRAVTRLGEQDRLVLLDPPVMGPFGVWLRQLKIPGHIACHLEASASITLLEQRDAMIRFQFGSKVFTYTRMGLEEENS